MIFLSSQAKLKAEAKFLIVVAKVSAGANSVSVNKGRISPMILVLNSLKLNDDLYYKFKVNTGVKLVL